MPKYNFYLLLCLYITLKKKKEKQAQLRAAADRLDRLHSTGEYQFNCHSYSMQIVNMINMILCLLVSMIDLVGINDVLSLRL